MDFNIVLHTVVAVAIGISVSMDVSGHNLAMASNTAYSSRPVTRSLTHAFWHGLFIAIGIGIIDFLAEAAEWLIEKFNLEWLFEWIAIYLPWFDPIKFPIWILTIIGVLLWLRIYWRKLRGEGSDDHLPRWFKRILRFFMVGAGQMAFVLVAMDMWFLTPLLKSIITEYSYGGKLAFVLVVTGTVYVCSYLSILYGQRLIQSRHAKSLFYWMVTFVWAEPVITGYFTVRAAWWAYSGEVENNTAFIVVTAIVVIGLCFGKFRGILENKWDEAEAAVAKLKQKET